MASQGYDAAYAAARVRTLEAQIEAHRANIVSLESELERYGSPFKGNKTTAPKRTRAKADD